MSEYSRVLKTLKLLISQDAKNAENGKIAPNWNVSGTCTFRPRTNLLKNTLPFLFYECFARSKPLETPVGPYA